MVVLLINPFTVRDGAEARFLELWDETSRLFEASPGFVSARLGRAAAAQAPGQSAPFTHVNVAEWASADHYADALRNDALRKFGPLYREVSAFDPALYEIVRDVGALSDRSGRKS
ncbi:MAG: antibiotic biosynthesis monooxygenase family protein [Parvularculaceae bacterium]